MPCSAITLSLATICAVVSVALLAIAFGTDNWQYINVDRIDIEKSLSLSDITPQEFEDSGFYRTRTKGLFRICYPETKPKGVDLYLSPVETYCENIDYHIFNEDSDTSQFTEDEMVRLHMARSMIALFIVSFFFVFVAFWTGVAGCWRRSPGNIASTAILMLLACLFSAGGMGLWHGVEYYEEEKLKTEPWKASWDKLLSDNTGVVYDWSYFIALIGVGWTLISALLFSALSVCLRSEREREDAKNMAYLMPVYSQKPQYPSYGYGYPGPYHYGSQYGPYNY
ncbi:LOW QUALITY PROTEIN: uncharacterized protein LOC121861078 [Homarus americanus]|uniref:LOW QUALITY PROTEIN: uncharacterized protein LOC121861078 n=1 Tax=Homarus americanus TaxID=6706 RepID=UPI001C440A06|nr:LOW QUALITY PROTEIN: uncharacterized protein LOC121861078 [Homarus americanus]